MRFTAKQLGLGDDPVITKLIEDNWKYDNLTEEGFDTIQTYLKYILRPPIYYKKWFDIAKTAVKTYEELYGCKTFTYTNGGKKIDGSDFISGDISKVYATVITSSQSFHDDEDVYLMYHLNSAGRDFTMLALECYWNDNPEDKHVQRENFVHVLNLCGLNILTDEEIECVITDGFSNHMYIRKKLVDHIANL